MLALLVSSTRCLCGGRSALSSPAINSLHFLLALPSAAATLLDSHLD